MPRQPRKLSAEEWDAIKVADGRCPAYCETHDRDCNISPVKHYTANGQKLHGCSYGQYGHNWWEKSA